MWSAQVGPGGEFAQTELFSAGNGKPPRRVTTTAANLDDHSPTLAHSGTVPVLIWTRTTSPAVPGPSDLMVKKYIGDFWGEPDRVLASLGTDNTSPDMAVRGGRTFVTWRRDGAIMVASDPGGRAFTSHRFLTLGFGPKVMASTTAGDVDHVFVSWTATPAGGERAFFAESATAGSVQDTWDGAFIAPTGSRVFGVSAFVTKATVTYGIGASVVARPEA